MKQLMLGNEAVARGLWEGGIDLITGYPGTPSTEITEYASAYPIQSEWAPNEKVALEAVFGASLAGARAACTMKHVGLNVAADPLFTFSYTGVRGGAVVCVADDPAMHSSQNEQDSRHYAVAAKLPMLEPSDSSDALLFARSAFALSERFDCPVMLRTSTRIAHAQSPVETGERVEREMIPYQKDAAKYIMMPAYARARHPLVEARMEALAEYAEDCPYNRVEWGGKEIGVITAGTCYTYVKEALGDSVSVLKLGMVHPLPRRMIRDFAEQVGRLVVVEELDGIIENHCRSMGLSVEGKSLFSPIGELSQDKVARAFGLPRPENCKPQDDLPPRPPVMCPGCPHRGIYLAMKRLGLTVFGDIGCYTLGAQPPLSVPDSTLCMGASISAMHGYLKCRPEATNKAVAVIGDSTFVHSGITSLCEMVYNGTAGTVVILDNSITGMTGHQQNPASGYNIKGDPAAKVDLEALCRALGVRRVRVADPADIEACVEALREETTSGEPSVIISRRPCALLKTVKHEPPLAIDPDKCRGCRRCLSAGCPAIGFFEKRARIDSTMCVGCGLCKQLCPFEAIG
ncbi:MAG: indolepyruvate ferredoxin oxidoreductase subunit alpha [Clostridia bacterium]|nr:indolepyruvate ferredoxin oxidoreductase subunit alpha [Clostridia bacterium]